MTLKGVDLDEKGRALAPHFDHGDELTKIIDHGKPERLVGFMGHNNHERLLISEHFFLKLEDCD